MTLAYFRTNPMLLVLICALATGLPLALALQRMVSKRWAVVIFVIFLAAAQLAFEAARAAAIAAH